MRTTQGAADFDLLGGQLFEAVKFARSDFDSAAKLFDHVRNENLAASEMFYADRLRWFMVGDSLPGDVSVKALGVDRRALYLETSPLLVDEINEALADSRVAARFDRRTRSFIAHSGRTLLTVTDAAVRQDFMPRVLWTIFWARLHAPDLELAFKVADAVYGRSVWQSDRGRDGHMSEAVQAVGAPRMELVHTMVQTLAYEQRPLLSIVPSPDPVQSMRMEIRPLLNLERRLLDAGSEELEQFAQRDLSPEGQRRTMRVLLFVLAGRIKREINQRLSWKQARRVAHGTVFRTVPA